MKKRVLSMILVIVLIVSLVPVNVYASVIDDFFDLLPDLSAVTVNITQEPVNVFARVGDTVSFTMTATADPNVDDVNYIWVDADKITKEYLDSIEVKVTNAVGDKNIIDNLKDSALGTGQTLTLKVDKAMNICCVAYVLELQSKILYFGLGVSEEVHVYIDTRPICESHDISMTTMQHFDAVLPSCMQSGTSEHYVCAICGQYFVVKNGVLTQTSAQACTIPKLTVHKLSYHPAQAGDCCTPSMPQYWQCDDCKLYFADASGMQSTTLDALRSSGVVDPTKHDIANIEHHSAQPATCKGDGNKEYWFCKGCNTYFLDPALTTGSKYPTYVADYKTPSTPHGTIKYMAAKDPGCETPGNYAYYYCAVCGACFDDADGKSEVTKELLVIPATGHAYRMTYDAQGHQQYCDKCKTSTQKEAHYGGTATCHSKAVCSVCNQEYGSLNANNHTNTRLDGAFGATVDAEGYSGDVYCVDCERVVEQGKTIPKLCQHAVNASLIEHVNKLDPTCQRSGNVEYWHCTQCDKYWANSMLTVELTRANVGVAKLEHYIAGAGGVQTRNPVLVLGKTSETEHWDECMYCGMEFPGTRGQHRITNMTPTCCTCNYCVDCEYSLKDYNYNNHTGGTAVVGKYAPDGNTPGYTGDTKCLGCQKIIETGKLYFDVCPAGNCKSHLKHVAAVPMTCTDDGVKEHYVCEMCGKMYKDEFAAVPTTETEMITKTTGHEIHPNVEDLENMLSLDGLKKILGSQVFTNLLAAFLGGDTPNVDDIVDMIHVSDIDHCHNDSYHWLGCQKCGKTLAELAPELADMDINLSQKIMELSVKQPHFGGKATCQSRAKCVECGEYYGDYAPHNFYENNICADCELHVKGCVAPKMTISYDQKTGVATFRWTEVTDAARYELWRANTKNGTYSIVYDGDDLSFVADELTGYGTNGYFKLRARGADGSYGDFTAIQHCQKKCASPVLKISNVTSTGKIKLTWAKIDGAVKYELYRATSEKGTYKLIKTSTGTSFTNTSTTAGTTYYYKMRAVATDGTASAYSAVVKRCCDCAKPVVKITNVSSSGAIKVSWTAVSGADKYYVYRATSENGTYKKVKTTTSTSYTNTSATVGKKYYYKVKAVSDKNSSSLSAYSDVVSRVRDCGKPTIRVGVWNKKPYVMWDEIDGADKYVVYRATSKSGTYTEIGRTTKTTYNDTKAKSGKTYYYKVMAISNKSTSANSAKSNIASYTCK